MSERNDDMISRDDLGGGDESRGEGLGDEASLNKVEDGALSETQDSRDEINERGFYAADEEQAERLLEEDRAGSLPNPEEPEHEKERHAKLLEADQAVRDRADEQSLEADYPTDDDSA